LEKKEKNAYGGCRFSCRDEILAGILDYLAL
jgi:hypothetical protein